MSPMEHDSDTVRRPIAWRPHPDDTAELAAEGKHCEGRRGTRRCQDPIAVVTWRWWKSAEARRVLVTERFLCEEHGREFAGRHQIEIGSRPARRSIRDFGPGAGGGKLTPGGTS
jgi:hypothetical protein